MSILLSTYKIAVEVAKDDNLDVSLWDDFIVEVEKRANISLTVDQEEWLNTHVNIAFHNDKYDDFGNYHRMNTVERQLELTRMNSEALHNS
jgi:hypothetical protein